MIRDVLMIDNFDSFTFNLVEAIERLGAKVRVLRNTVAAEDAMEAALASGALILLSPGPGRPEDAGCCLELIRRAKARVPLLGICLGHQAIVLEAGGMVERAPEPVHGKVSLLAHDGSGPFAGIEGPVRIGRYHSLCTRDLPPRFTVHAAIDGMAMTFSDRDSLQWGLQFHPESILTPVGGRILSNILATASAPSASGDLAA